MTKETWKKIGKECMFYGNLTWVIGFAISLITSREIKKNEGN